jgi:hypothetical protein
MEKRCVSSAAKTGFLNITRILMKLMLQEAKYLFSVPRSFNTLVFIVLGSLYIVMY